MPKRWTAKRIELLLLAAVLVGAAVHDLALAGWTIEDAAIDFGYAKHLVDGQGLVPTPGGEWLEGYSNPTWLLLMAATTALGADPFLASHVLGFVLSMATVLVVWRAASEVAPRDSGIPLLAPAFLATNTQFGMWGTAGLENPLWNLLFALGIWGLLVEVRADRPPRYPWSSLAWLLLSLTRPEGILYAAVAGFTHLVLTVSRHHTIRPALQWLVTFFAPWTAYQAWHYETFAWPFANTYYAKVMRHEHHPTRWGGDAWMWSRNFFFRSGQGFFLPVWILGVVGGTGPRLYASAAVVAAVGLVVELGGDQHALLALGLGLLWLGLHLALLRTEPDPRVRRRVMAVATGVAIGLVLAAEVLRWLGYAPASVPVPSFARTLPPYVLVALAPVVALLGLRAPNAALRVPAWAFCCAAVFFAIYSEGDWMKGYRWYALATVPGSLLFAFGAHEAALLLEDVFALAGRRLTVPVALGPLGIGAATLLVLLEVPTNAYRTWQIAQDPDASPWGVVPRIDYVRKLAAKLHWDEPLTVLDVDMGAHLLWTDFHMLDIAGLVDVPFAHHHWDPAFLREYVFREEKPLTLHVHDFWATRTRIPSQPEFKRDYVEVPPFPSGRNALHVGTYVRRDALLRHDWPRGTPPATFGGGVRLSAPWIPAEPATGGLVYVEVAMARPPRPPQDFRVLLFASDGDRTRAWDLPPTYDWVKPGTWGPREVFVGKYSLPLGDLPPGTYDLGYVVLGEDGAVLPVQGAGDAPARLATGELRFPGALRVTTAEERDRAAREALDRTASLAEAGSCVEGESAWAVARHLREGDHAWAEEHEGAVGAELARCWARSADAEGDVDQRVHRLLRAHRWDFDEPEAVSRARSLAAELYDEGLAARDRQDWEAAYRRFSDAVALDGRLTWARRYAEEARSERLHLEE